MCQVHLNQPIYPADKVFFVPVGFEILVAYVAGFHVFSDFKACWSNLLSLKLFTGRPPAICNLMTSLYMCQLMQNYPSLTRLTTFELVAGLADADSGFRGWTGLSIAI